MIYFWTKDYQLYYDTSFDIQGLIGNFLQFWPEAYVKQHIYL